MGGRAGVRERAEITSSGRFRCGWSGDDERMIRYHDEEWGVPVHDDRKWFELMVLDAFQAGLSWRTVLHKREAFRRVFHDFVPERVAAMDEAEVEAALRDRAIIRNRTKVRAAIRNAARFIEVREAEGSFDAYIWGFTGGETIRNGWESSALIPARTNLSDRLSLDLKSRGFSFAGSTICYAILQSGGIVNDHLAACFRFGEL